MNSLGLALSLFAVVSRAPYLQNVQWTPFENGYSINSDLLADDDNSPYVVNFDSEYYLTGFSVSYFDNNGYKTPTITRDTNFTNGSNTCLFGFIRQVNSTVPLQYTYNDVGNKYSYKQVPSSYASEQTPQFVVVSFNSSLFELNIETNIQHLLFYVSVDWYSDLKAEHNFYNGDITYASSDYYTTQNIALSLDNADFYNISVYCVDGSRSQVYLNGYNDGYSNGTTYGSETGYNNGYSVGYNVGFTNGVNSTSQFADLLFTIADTPIYYLKSLFNFELFGVNVAVAILSLMTLAIALWVVHKVV